jgi:hypothetical protein
MLHALLDYTQDVLHKRKLVYCVSVMSVGCTTAQLSTPAGTESHTRTEDHPLLPTGQQLLKQKEL